MKPSAKSCFTLAEVVIATGILALLMAVVLPFSLGVLKSYMNARIQNELDVSAETVGEMFKKDLQVTSSHEILMSPDDGSTVQGVSFPILRRNRAAPDSPFNADGEILWTETVVYHLFGPSGNSELRKTVINPFNRALTFAQRQEQLDYILARGNAVGTYDGNLAVTRTIATGVSSYAITFQGEEIDCYSDTLRTENTSLGVWVMRPGEHTFLYNVSSRNPASSNYHLGLDSFVASPTGHSVEGEYYIPPLSSVGATVAAQDMSAYSGWSNSSQLSFPAIAVGNSFSYKYYYDTWLESSFSSSTAVLSGTKINYSATAGEIVVTLDGNQTVWDATTQTGAALAGEDTNRLNYTIRVLVAGTDPVLGGNISHDGRQCRVTFSAHPSTNFMNITSAFIMEQQADFSGVAATVKRLTFSAAAGSSGTYVYNSGNSVAFVAGNSVTSDFADLPIQHSKNYLVSFHLADLMGSGGGWTAKWEPPGGIPQAGVRHSQAIPNDVADNTATADWSGIAGKEDLTRIPGVASVFASYPAEATYTSRVFDTRMDDPAYNEVHWREVLPTGTSTLIRVRAGDQADLSDATAWDSALSFTAATGANSLGSLPRGRYVQFQAALRTGSPYTATPELRDVIITWPGAERAVDLSANLAKGPDMGKFWFMVDGFSPPVAGMQMKCTLTRTFLRQVTNKTFAVAVSPRNP
jgi:hypothetical protein